jgi:hypothetical protein
MPSTAFDCSKFFHKQKRLGQECCEYEYVMHFKVQMRVSRLDDEIFIFNRDKRILGGRLVKNRTQGPGGW